MISDYAKREHAEKEARIRNAKRTAELAEIIKPLRTARYECDFAWPYAQKALADFGKDYGGLELIPDFQRGHVWTPDQQRHFIEMRCVVSCRRRDF